MRLIDADALIQKMENTRYFGMFKNVEIISNNVTDKHISFVNEAPTVEERPHETLESAIDYLTEIGWLPEHDRILTERPHGEWEAVGFQKGYAFCRCSNCHKTMRLYLDSKNEFCCIADIRKKVVSCMYCGADMRGGDEK